MMQGNTLPFVSTVTLIVPSVKENPPVIFLSENHGNTATLGDEDRFARPADGRRNGVSLFTDFNNRAE